MAIPAPSTFATLLEQAVRRTVTLRIVTETVDDSRGGRAARHVEEWLQPPVAAPA